MFAQRPFIGKWESKEGKITLPARGTFSYTYAKVELPTTILGSGNSDPNITTVINVSQDGEYIISISPTGELGFSYGDEPQPTPEQFKEIQQWGDITWAKDLTGAFLGCIHLTISATDLPNFSTVTDMSSMFSGCSSITNIPNINQWDVSKVETMTSMFRGAGKFNADISNWKVGEVKFMNQMFYEAIAFNQDISGWAVSSVTRMNQMFYGATAFNQNLAGWAIKDGAQMTDFFTGSGLSCENYSKALKGWADNPNIGKNVSFSSAKTYGVGAETYKNILANEKKWRISGDSYDPSCTPDLSTEDVAHKPTFSVLNPVKDELMIQGLGGIKTIEIYSANGRWIKTLVGSQREVSSLPRGLYILKITTEKATYTEKIIKK